MGELRPPFGSKEVESAEVEVNDPVEGELRATMDTKKAESADAANNDPVEGDIQDSRPQVASRSMAATPEEEGLRTLRFMR